MWPYVVFKYYFKKIMYEMTTILNQNVCNWERTCKKNEISSFLTVFLSVLLNKLPWIIPRSPWRLRSSPLGKSKLTTFISLQPSLMTSMGASRGSPHSQSVLHITVRFFKSSFGKGQEIYEDFFFLSSSIPHKNHWKKFLIFCPSL